MLNLGIYSVFVLESWGVVTFVIQYVHPLYVLSHYIHRICARIQVGRAQNVGDAWVWADKQTIDSRHGTGLET